MKKIALGLLLGGLVGLWFGINIGRGAGLLANPFDNVNPLQQGREQAESMIERLRE